MFVLKKLITPILMPSTFSLILLLVGGALLYWRYRRWAAVCLGVSVSMMILSSMPLGIYYILKPLESRYAPFDLDAHRDIEYMVILGAGYNESAGLPLTSQFNHDGLVRLSEGAVLANQLPQARIIVSGYHGVAANSRSFAQVASDYLVSLGIDRQRIIIEPRARDTSEEARFIRHQIADEKVALITTASHMPRAMALFTAQGVNAIAAPVGHSLLPPIQFWRWPSLRRFSYVDQAVHEYLGITWGWLNGDITEWPL